MFCDRRSNNESTSRPSKPGRDQGRGLAAEQARVLLGRPPSPTGIICQKVDANFVPERYLRPMFPGRVGHTLITTERKGSIRRRCLI
jgi:hypothetical protein